jgi:signal transduction histidine kinase
MVNKAWRVFCQANDFLLPDYGAGTKFRDLAKDYWSFYSSTFAEVAAKIGSVCSGEQSQILFASEMQVGPDIHYYQVTLSRLMIGEQQRIIVAHGDATAVVRLAEERRSGATRLLAAQLEDRRRVGRELHDSFSQAIAAIGLTTTHLRYLANTPELKAQIEELDGLVAEAHRETRTHSYLLHPPQLSGVGLKEALERYVGGYSRRTGITTSFDWNVENAERLAPCCGQPDPRS